MDYQKHYDLLIVKHGLKDKPPTGYFERHHLKPKSLGGSNDPSNLVYLSARCHFIAHWLLHRIHGGKMTFAFWGMCNQDRYGNRHIPTSTDYEEARKYVAMKSSSMNKGRVVSEKLRAERSARMGGRSNISCREDVSEWRSKFQTGSGNNQFGVKPWNNPKTRNRPELLQVWSMADTVYDWWLSVNSKPRRSGGYSAADHFGFPRVESWKSLISYIKNHGDPRLDPDWVSFKQSHGGRYGT